MALNSYANLKVAIRNWTERDDVDESVIDDVILLAEKEMFENPEQTLKVREMETRSFITLSTSDRFESLPTGYIDFRRIYIDIDGYEYDLTYRDPNSLCVYNTTGRPAYYTITDQIELDRTPDQAYTLRYNAYIEPTGLSDSNTTNVILTSYPQIYLDGCKWAAYRFGQEDEQGQVETAYQEFLRRIRGANKKSRRGRHSPLPRMVVAGSTP